MNYAQDLYAFIHWYRISKLGVINTSTGRSTGLQIVQLGYQRCMVPCLWLIDSVAPQK